MSTYSISSRQDLADYCLRKLGGGVVNVEVSSDQLDDCINDAIEYYNEYHFDGVERDFLIHKVSGTSFTIASVSGFAVGQTLSCNTKGIFTTINNISGNTITINRINGPYGVVFANGDAITNGVITTTINSTVTLGDIDKGYISVDDGVMGIVNVVNAPFLSSGYQGADLLFSANYQLMAGQVQSLLSSGGTLQAYYGTMSYLSEMEFLLKKQKSFRFNRRMNKVFLDVNWDQDIFVGNYLALEVYRIVDDEVYTELLNDIWLKRYATALIKRQNGTNLKKYQGMQLPGGLTYNGQQIFDEAVQEIELLEKEAIENSAPLFFQVG